MSSSSASTGIRLHEDRDWRTGQPLESKTTSSLIRVKRCRKCNSNFLLGQNPRSPYYKACRCGGSDSERKRQGEWIPMTTLQPVETPMKPKMDLSSLTPPTRLAEPIQTCFLRTQVGRTWNDFSHQFRIASRRSKKVAGSLGEAFKGKAAEVLRQFCKPELTIPQGQHQRRCHRKRNASSRTWFRGIRRWVSLATIRRRFRILVTPTRNFAFVAEVEEQAVFRIMSATQKVKGQPPPVSTFEYENEAFQANLPDEVGIRKRIHNVANEAEASPVSGSSGHAQRNSDLNFGQENFTIGSTSSLIVAVLSYASFAYFVMWLVLYSSTLDLILPEMKYLHKYVTVCSLLLMTSLNFFRFYICQNADKGQNAYLFTGTKTLTVLVIGALTSLLVTDSYSEPPRAFHIIISGIMMMLLVAEGVAMFIHQRLLRSITNDRIRQSDVID